MKFGKLLLPKPVEELRDAANLAERYEFDLLGLGDSQSVYREVYTNLGLLASETESIAIGPLVTNPVTRHPVVTASAIATLDEATDGRGFLGIASGDSAVYTIGDRPAYRAELESSIRLIRSLCRGETVERDGTALRLRWVQDAGQPREVPIVMAAEGPKSLQLAGRVADAVLVGLGVEPDVIETAVEWIGKGARDAGRNPVDVETWFWAAANVRDDRETALDELKSSLAGAAHHSLQFTVEGKAVPDERADALQTLVDEYDSGAHGDAKAANNRELVENLGLSSYLADRYAIAGTPDDCIETLEAVRSTGQVDGIILGGHAQRDVSIVRDFGEHVLPHL